MDTASHTGIIEVLASQHVPDDFIPYNTLLMLLAVFALVIWLASRALKRLRKREWELEKQLKESDRQHKRDEDVIEFLTDKLGEYYLPDEADDEMLNSS